MRSTSWAPIVFLDEFGDYVDGRNNSLKEGLRKSDGVPHATYGVLKDGQVFVFDKWEQRVNERQKRQSGFACRSGARPDHGSDRFRKGGSR